MGILFEGLGMSVLRAKIATSQSVAGVSGQTLIMFAIANLAVASSPTSFIEAKIFVLAARFAELIELLLVFDVARCIFIKYKHTREDEGDDTGMKCAIGFCAFSALVFCPYLAGGGHMSVKQTFYMYLDA